jgi:hypothetical protein
MSTKKRHPQQALTNEQILADRVERIEANRRVVAVDLGLGLKEKDPESATEFLADEFDRKAFGDETATITRIIWGPDPLIDQCPQLRAALDRYGRQDYAEAAAENIRRAGHKGIDNPLIQRSLERAIMKFGVEAVADAFRARILGIPFRTVEVDASDTFDTEVQGSSVLSECIEQNERPGMAYRFFAQAVLDRYGWRGYTPVRLASGDIVKAGTLFLGEITLERLDVRRRRLAAAANDALEGLSLDQVAGQENELRKLRNDGYMTNGIAPMGVDENLTFPGVESSQYAGKSGVHLSREAPE